MENFKKISIIGANGTGKSTLARILSKKLSTPIVHMDSFIWGPNWELIDRKLAEDKIKKELQEKDSWIAEGYLTCAPKEILQDSDFVIYLDYSKYKAFVNNIKRWLKHRKIQREELPEGCPDTFSFSSLVHILQGGVTQLIEDALVKYPPKKMIRIKSYSSLKKFLKEISIN